MAQSVLQRNGDAFIGDCWQQQWESNHHDTTGQSDDVVKDSAQNLNQSGHAAAAVHLDRVLLARATGMRFFFRIESGF